MRITISGPPGSGKTTVCKLLAARLGYRYVISGIVFREMAAKLNLSLTEFGRLAQDDPKYDRMIDESMVALAAADHDIVLEGRLAGHNLARQKLLAFKVYLDADPMVRAARILEREKGDLRAVTTEMLDRERCEADRYLQWYGIDVNDMSVYDLIVDTSNTPPEKVVEIIAKKLEGFPRPT
ncbi:MAG: AAA family ATPase [Methanomassiliicoccales archaeon]|nr:AAA family ATPase [Methanomassiliicoccales archaeon]